MKRSLRYLFILGVAIILVLMLACVVTTNSIIIAKKEKAEAKTLELNESNNNQVIIKKVDLNGEPLSNTNYKIILDNVKEVRVNGSDIIEYSPTNKGYEGKLTLDAVTNEEGLIVLTDIKPFYIGDIDMNGLVEETDVNLISTPESLTSFTLSSIIL